MRRILILTDTYGWALDHVFQTVRPVLESRFSIKYLAVHEIPLEGRLSAVCRYLPLPLHWAGSEGFFRSFDGIFAFYSLLLNHIHPRVRDLAACGVHCHYEFTDNRSPETLTRTVESPSRVFLERLGKKRLIAAPARRLVSILESCGLRARHVPNAVDPALFFPVPAQHNRGPLRVGWCQSESNHTFKRRIAEIRRVYARLPDVDLVEIPQDRPIQDRNEMRNWYNSLDCYVCFSICEGGPMPVLEAMACGVPCVSTPVGHVPEIIEHGVNGWIVKSESELESTLQLLADNRGLLVNAGRQAREAILAQRTAETVGPYWIHFFEEMTGGA
jgi:Glycosyl transferases group 1